MTENTLAKWYVILYYRLYYMKFQLIF